MALGHNQKGTFRRQLFAVQPAERMEGACDREGRARWLYRTYTS